MTQYCPYRAIDERLAMQRAVILAEIEQIGALEIRQGERKLTDYTYAVGALDQTATLADKLGIHAQEIRDRAAEVRDKLTKELHAK